MRSRRRRTTGSLEVDAAQVGDPGLAPARRRSPLVAVEHPGRLAARDRASRCRRARRGRARCRPRARRGSRRRASVASCTGDTSTGFCVASASACTNVGLRDIPPSIAQHLDRRARVGLGRLDQVGAAVGDALEHRAHELRPAGAAGEAEHGAARAVVPLRRAEPEQRGHEHDAAGVGALRRDLVRSRPTTTMIPRSSRSHSTLVPAASMIASRPHVSCAADAATRRSGTCPPPPRVSNAGPVAEHDVEHPAGAERDLGRPRPHARPARAATPAGRRRARRSAARPAARSPRPTIPLESTTVGSIDARDVAATSSARRSPVGRRRRRSSPVTPALLASVTWTRAARTASTRSTSRRCRSSRSRVAVGVVRCRAGTAIFVADTFGAKRKPFAC